MPVLWYLVARLQRARTDQSGQSTAEYALVIVAAAALAGLLVSFLGHSSIVSGIFGKIVNFVMGHIL